MNLRFRRSDPGTWPLDTWRASEDGDGLFGRHTVLVVGAGPLATRVVRRCSDSSEVILTGRAADAEAAAAAIEVLRPDYALVCGGSNPHEVGAMVREVHGMHERPGTRVVIVSAIGDRVRYLPLVELVPYEARLLEDLAGSFAPVF